jgi:hypothetical protein
MGRRAQVRPLRSGRVRMAVWVTRLVGRGAGKTYTMIGELEEASSGLLPRAIDYLFRRFEERGDTHRYKVRRMAPHCLDEALIQTPPRPQLKLSCLEIYKELVTDMMVPTNERTSLAVREHSDFGFFVEGGFPRAHSFTVSGLTPPSLTIASLPPSGLRIQPCPDRDTLLKTAGEALRSRKVGAHNLNARSNRSHLMLTVYLDSRVQQAGAGPTTYGSITFVDLAGSERLKVRVWAQGEVKVCSDAEGAVPPGCVGCRRRAPPVRRSRRRATSTGACTCLGRSFGGSLWGRWCRTGTAS